MELHHCHILPVCKLCIFLTMGVSLIRSSESTAQLSTVGKYRIQYCQKLNFLEEHDGCGGLYSNESRIMETCRKENYSNSCNIYTSPEDDSIFFCMKTEGSSQCINIHCNSTFRRQADYNEVERLYTDTLSQSCVYKYTTIEPKDCVNKSSDEVHVLKAEQNVSQQKDSHDCSHEELHRSDPLLLNDPSLYDRRLQQLESQIQSLTSKLHLAETTISQLSQSNKGQMTYVRWGTHGCKANATLVYSGQIGGSAYSQTGNGANPLCMVHEVLWGTYQPNKNMAEIWDAEYQDDFWGPGTLDQDVPCAVCSPKQGTSVLMIPGRNRCVSGWTEQYHGYLSVNLVGHPQATTYVCVDENVELIDAGANDVNGFLMYGVRGHCGSLKCPPYIEGKPITCVVCSI